MLIAFISVFYLKEKLHFQFQIRGDEFTNHSFIKQNTNLDAECKILISLGVK